MVSILIGTYYDQIQGDGSSGIVKLVVSSNVITRFGESGVSTVQDGVVQNILFSNNCKSRIGTNIYTDASLSTSLISGSTLTSWNSVL